VDVVALEQGLKAIQEQGFEVELAAHVLKQNGYLAGTSEQRAADLQAFFRRSDISAIFCARGGFGSIQLLPQLAKAPPLPAKIFVSRTDGSHGPRQRIGIAQPRTVLGDANGAKAALDGGLRGSGPPG
jgi:hypothetical protein